MTKDLYLHDLWVNFKQEDNFYNVPDYHEWSKENDEIELLDQVLLLKVNPDTFNYIAFGDNQVEDDIAQMIENRAYLRKNHNRIQCRFIFVMSDGERTLTVKLDDDQRVTEKSHLASRQYQLSIEMVADEKNHFEKDYKCEISKYRNNAGLTRSERESYKKLDEFMLYVSESDLPMLKYLLSEIDYPTYKTMRNGSYVDYFNAISNIPVETVVSNSADIETLLGRLSKLREVAS